MSDVMGHFERLVDIVFNGRKADPAIPVTAPIVPDLKDVKTPISMVELIERKTSVVRCGGKMYSVTVAEIGAEK